MKRIVALFILLALIGACRQPAKNSFTIKGTIEGSANGWVFLQEQIDDQFKTVDSVMIDGGKFKFSGVIDFPSSYFLNLRSSKTGMPLFLEASKIDVSINIKNINKSTITGSKSQEEYEKFLDIMDKYNARRSENGSLAAKAAEIGDEAKAAYYDSLAMDVTMQRARFIKDYVAQNKTSPITPYLLYYNRFNYDMKELNEVVANLDTTLNASPYTGLVKDYLKSLKRSEIGKLYISFMMQDTTGIYLPLVDLIGKNYVLLDFWASWCAPCRKENPELVKIYHEYKDKGFDIMGISLDRKKEDWMQAIRDDKLAWHQVSDLKYWDNTVAKLYNIRAIPSNVLIDPSGIIIAKDLFGDDLRKKLDELLNKPGA